MRPLLGWEVRVSRVSLIYLQTTLKLVQNTSPKHHYSTICNFYTNSSCIFILIYGCLDGPPLISLSSKGSTLRSD